MTLKFKLTATIEVPNAYKFPPKKVVEKDIAEMLKLEGMVSHELAVTDYMAEIHCMGDKTYEQKRSD